MEKVPALQPEVCFWDLTFDMTDGLNGWFSTHVDFKKKCLMFCSFCMDFMQIFGVAVLALRSKSYRIICSFVLFFILRQSI